MIETFVLKARRSAYGRPIVTSMVIDGLEIHLSDDAEVDINLHYAPGEMFGPDVCVGADVSVCDGNLHYSLSARRLVMEYGGQR